MTYLLDTSVIVSSLRGDVSPSGKTQLSHYLTTGSAVSIVSVAEYADGAYRTRHPEETLKLWERFREEARLEVLLLDEETAVAYGRIRADLATKGAQLSTLDALIAATALHHRLTLVTQDRDFRRVPELDVSFVA